MLNKFIGTKQVEAESAIGRQGADGFRVVYSDGYESWSPADVFIDAYRPLHRLGFGEALFLLKRGSAVARAGWNGKNMCIQMQTPTSTSKMTLPYIYINTAQGDLVPWLASQTDLLAEDWYQV